MGKRQGRPGFTIVELLIVIGIIAILAAITAVAYIGVQGRAHDTAVAADMATYAKKIELFIADTGRMPSSTADLDSIDMRVTAASYAVHTNAVMYCMSPNANMWSIAGASKSGVNGYYYNSAQGKVQQRAYWNVGNPCSYFGVQHNQAGDWAAYKSSAQTWGAGGSHAV